MALISSTASSLDCTTDGATTLFAPDSPTGTPILIGSCAAAMPVENRPAAMIAPNALTVFFISTPPCLRADRRGAQNKKALAAGATGGAGSRAWPAFMSTASSPSLIARAAALCVAAQRLVNRAGGLSSSGVSSPASRHMRGARAIHCASRDGGSPGMTPIPRGPRVANSAPGFFAPSASALGPG